MDTAAACRTYNILAQEGQRRAVALLLDPPGLSPGRPWPFPGKIAVMRRGLPGASAAQRENPIKYQNCHTQILPMVIVVNKPLPEFEANATGGIKVTNPSHVGP